MKTDSSYALGYSAEEHVRLVRQAALVAPWTDRLFRAAGVGPGHRVLDLGSGLGDVSLLLSNIVGTDGEVVGLERDANSIAKATARVETAGISNISFVHAEASNPPLIGQFDAIVGRFILMYLPDPARTLRDLTKYLRPGGAVAFMEPSWSPSRGLAAHLPLYSMTARLIVEAFVKCGVDPEMGTALNRTFLAAGLPAPEMKIEMMLGADSEFPRALCYILTSLVPKAREKGLALDALGDLSTLQHRLQNEMRESGDPLPWLAAHVGAWCRKPDSI